MLGRDAGRDEAQLDSFSRRCAHGRQGIDCAQRPGCGARAGEHWNCLARANWWLPKWLDRIIPRISVEAPPPRTVPPSAGPTEAKRTTPVAAGHAKPLTPHASSGVEPTGRPSTRVSPTASRARSAARLTTPY